MSRAAARCRGNRPRSRGASRAQAHALAASRVPVVAWVACDPVTFARDARIMAEGGPTTGHLRHDGLTGDQIHALASGYGLAFIACAAFTNLATTSAKAASGMPARRPAPGRASSEGTS